MRRLFCIGEVLIDFIPMEKGKELKDVVLFERTPGGAPANVASSVSKFGGQSVMLTKVGKDAFGDFLIETLERAGVVTDYIVRSSLANTGLAFVSLREDGERDFSFYRNPSADLLFDSAEVDETIFREGDYLHFCSVDLVESPMKEAHKRVIQILKERKGIISFDPNVRLPLWESPEECKKAIMEFLPFANIVKVSEEELTFITGIEDEQLALQNMFIGDVEVVIYTKGAAGSVVVTKNHFCRVDGYKVKVVDTTGAGDAFVGGFLFCLLEADVTLGNLVSMVEGGSAELLAFANACGALTTTKKGAISALPLLEEVERLMVQGGKGNNES